jgi:ketosteroid isomerase-like protein
VGDFLGFYSFTFWIPVFLKGGNMKKLLMILPLALILCFMVGCQDKEAMAELEAMKSQSEDAVAKAKQDVEKVLRQNEVALLNSDMEWVDNFLDNKYILTIPTGKRYTKSERIARLKSAELDYLDIKRTDTEIRISGDTAVVTGQVKVIIKSQGREIDLPPARFTTVLIKRDGRWKNLARHASEIEQ